MQKIKNFKVINKFWISNVRYLIKAKIVRM